MTIRSADPSDPAVFTGLYTMNASNVTLEGVTFDYRFASGDPIYERPFQVNNSQNIVIRDSVFDGDVARGVGPSDDGFGTGVGLAVRGSTGVTIEGNEVTGFHRGLVFDRSSTLRVLDNDVHTIRSDGMNFAQVQNVLIEGNHLHDFAASPGSGDHRDMIQFWTTGTTAPSVNVTIRDNLLDIGQGNYTQSIFMRNELVDTGQAGASMFYRNVTIEGNVIYNAHLHGITVGETAGLTIRGNAVLAAESTQSGESGLGGVQVPVINVARPSTGVTITQNAVAAVNGGGAGWEVRQNAYIQATDPQAPGYYGSQFVTSSLSDRGDDGGHHYVVRPGSMLDTLGAGPAALDRDATPDRVTAQFEAAAGDAARLVRFDARLTADAEGALAGQPGAQFLWDFGDGTTARGLVVEHEYARAGRYTATLTVVAPDGARDTAAVPVAIAGADLVSFDRLTGRFAAQEAGVSTLLDTALGSVFGAAGARALLLGGSGVDASIGKNPILRLMGTDNFDIGLTLRGRAGAEAWGEVFRIHTSLVAGVTREGNISLQISTTDGKTHSIITSGGQMRDGNAHSIAIRFDGDGAGLTILIDGQVAASRAISGTLAGSGNWGLTFGNPWGQKNFEGTLSAFDINANPEEYQNAPATGQTEVITAEPSPIVVEAPPETAEGVSDEGVSGGGESPAEDEGTTDTPSSDEDDGTTPPTGETGEDADPAVPALDGFKIDFAAIAANPGRQLGDGARIVTEGGAPVLQLDGDRDFLNVGRLQQYEASDQIAFSVDFSRDVADGSADRVVWNHMKVGLQLSGDGLTVFAATADQGFKAFYIADVGLNDTDLHRAVVMLDQTEDRLQVIIDDQVVLDRTDVDFQFTGAGNYEWGWTLGTAWNQFFDGEVTDFRVSDRFSFVEGHGSDVPLAG